MKYTVTIVLLIFSIQGISQTFPYTFQTWDTKNGLSSNYCNVIAKDTSGYLYIGTNNGLYIFNGSNFKTLPYNISSNLMTEGNVEDILIDQYNRIWFASIEYGVGLINLNVHNIRVQYFVPPVPDSSSNPAISGNPKVSKLCFDSNGNLWVGTRGNGLFKLDTTTKAFTLVRTDNEGSFYNRHIRSLFLYKPDTLFVGLVNGLSIINPINDDITHLKMYYAKEKKPLRPTVRKVLPWSADSFLLATDRGTFWLHLHKQVLSNIYYDTLKKINFRDINSNDIIRFSNDELWIATEDDGILFYNLRTHQFNYSFRLSEFNTGITRGFVSRFFKGRDGDIWIAHQNGLGFFQIQNAWFNNFSYSDSRLLTGTLLTDKQYLLCFKANSVTRINTETGEAKLTTINIPAKENTLHCHAIDYSPDKYMLFIDQNFFLMDKKTFQLRSLPLKKETLDPEIFKHFRVIKSIPDTLEGKERFFLLVKTPDGNILFNYYPASGDLIPFIPPGFKSDDFRNGFTNIVKAGNGKYWISTLYNGMIYVDGKDSSIQFSDRQKSERQKIPEGEIKDFTLTTNNDLWLLMQKKGLVHISLNKQNGRCYEVFSEQQGLTDNRLYTIVTGPQHTLWMTSNSGIFCFLTRQKEFLKYTAANGFGNMKFHLYDISMAALSNGYIGIFEQVGNVTWFKPEVNSNEKKVNLILNSMQVNDQTINLKAAVKRLHLSPYQNNIAFQYDVIDFDKTSFYEVLYKLENYDNQWQPAYQNKIQRYTQLPPGSYTFKIKLQYANDHFSPEKFVQFNIATIWYKTWWFKSIAALLSLGMIYLVIRNYINRKLYQQKKELELQNAVAIERSRISTELHDDLGSGLSTIRILCQTLNCNSNSNLEKISSHSQELIQKMREIVWALNNENDTLDQLISYIRRQSSTMLENADISYEYDVPEVIPEIKVTGGNRRHIQLLVKEAIHNIIKHAQAEKVLFTITINKALTIIIYDNGIGIRDDFADASPGNGMRNMKKHTEAIQGVLTIENHIGTTIQFSMPLQSLSHESAI
ncbi:MAG: hypothetical protein IT249_16125 [Chitinophagaceae bacterium]|nr:hypothetical protein [Chitinophagaceae bacterium]